jgi:hypothetical protein
MRLFVVLAVMALTVTGCRIETDDDGPSTRASAKPSGTAIDLGTAVYPDGTDESGASVHTWNAKLRPAAYRVGYALGAPEGASVDEAFRRWAGSVHFARVPNGRFGWSPPRGCGGDLHCVYENIAERGAGDLEPLVERFRARQRAAKLSTLDLGALVVTFVQSIRYEVPNDEPFGILPPPLVVSQRRGDCDSKALLGHMLLRSLGIDSIIVSSAAHHHAMLGIALPVPGTMMTIAGRRYAFTETTAKGSPIGHINPSLLAPNDWRPVAIRIR